MMRCILKDGEAKGGARRCGIGRVRSGSSVILRRSKVLGNKHNQWQARCSQKVGGGCLRSRQISQKLGSTRNSRPAVVRIADEMHGPQQLHRASLLSQ
jgi:hypothetical protein